MDVLNRISARISASKDAPPDPSCAYVWWDGMPEDGIKTKDETQRDALVIIDAPGDMDHTVRISLADWREDAPGDGILIRASIEMTAEQIRTLARRLANIAQEIDKP